MSPTCGEGEVTRWGDTDGRCGGNGEVTDTASGGQISEMRELASRAPGTGRNAGAQCTRGGTSAYGSVACTGVGRRDLSPPTPSRTENSQDGKQNTPNSSTHRLLSAHFELG